MLTERQVKAATYEGYGDSWDVRWDAPDGVPGFGVRVYPSGRKSYLVLYRVAGRRRTYTIGSTATFTLKQARDRAKRISLDAADGTDPLAERRRAQDVETFGDLCLLYLEEHSRRNKTERSARDDAWRLGYRWDGSSGRLVEIDYGAPLPGGRRRKRSLIRDRLSRKPITAIVTQDVIDLHESLSDQRGSYEANRQQELVRGMFYFARSKKLFPSDVPNPARAIPRKGGDHADLMGVPRNRERRRKRWVRRAEMRRLAEAVQQEEDLYVRAAIWLSLVVGCRKSELLSATWEDVDLETRELVVRNPKGSKLSREPEEEHVYTLPADAVAILQALPRESEWVFPTPRQSASGHRTDFRAPWKRIRTAADLEDVRWHDLRRSTGSWLASAGESLHLIGSVLGHRDSKVTEIYARLADTERQRAVEGVSAKILEAAGLDVETIANGVRPTDEPEDDSEVTPEGLRAEAAALLKRAEHQAQEQEETRFAAIDLLTRAEELESGR